MLRLLLQKLNLKLILVLGLLFLSQWSCFSGSSNSIQDQGLSSPDTKEEPKPKDDGNSPPVTIASPPILFLQARGTFFEDEGIFLVNGRVTDQDNNPVFQANVSVINTRTSGQELTQTDVQGEFEQGIEARVGDVILVQATHPRFPDPSNEVELKVVKDYAIILAGGSVIYLDHEMAFNQNTNPKVHSIPHRFSSYILSRDRKTLILGHDRDERISFFDLQDMKQADLDENGLIDDLDFINMPSPVQSLALHPNENLLYVLHGNSQSEPEDIGLSVIDLDQKQRLDLNDDGLLNFDDKIPLDDYGAKVIIKGDGTYAYVLHNHSLQAPGVTVLDATNHRRLEFQPNNFINENGLIVLPRQDPDHNISSKYKNLKSNPIQSYLYVYDGANFKLWVIDESDWTLDRKISVGTDPVLNEERANDLREAPHYSYGMAIDSDGEFLYLVNQFDESLSIIDLNRLERKDLNQDGLLNSDDDLFVGGSPFAVQFNPNEDQLFVSANDGTIKIFQTEDLQAYDWNEDGLRNQDDFLALGDGVNLNNDNRRDPILFGDFPYLYVVSYRNNSLSSFKLDESFTFSQYSSISEGILEDFDLHYWYNFLISPDQQTSYYIHASQDYILFIDNNNRQIIDINQDGQVDERDRLFVGDFPYEVIQNRDGSRLYILNADSASVSVIDTIHKTYIDVNGDGLQDRNDQIQVGAGPFAAVLSNDESQLYVLNQFDHSLSVIDTNTFQRIEFENHPHLNQNGDIDLPEKAYSLTLTPDGEMIYIGFFDAQNENIPYSRILPIATSDFIRVDIDHDGELSEYRNRWHETSDLIETGENVISFLHSDDSKVLYTLNYGSASVTFINTETQKRLDRNQDGLLNSDDDLILHGRPSDMIFSHDQSQIIIYCQDNTSIFIIDIQLNDYVDINRDGLRNQDDYIDLNGFSALLGTVFYGDYIYLAGFYGQVYLIDTLDYSIANILQLPYPILNIKMGHRLVPFN